MRALSIAWKDLRRTYRSWAGLAMMLAAPLLLAFVLGQAFGSGDSFSIAAVKTVVVDQDEGAGAGMPAAGATLVSVLTSKDMADLLDVTIMATPESARSAVDSGDAHVAVIIPTGLTTILASTDSKSTALVEIYKDPALTVGPAVVSAVVSTVVQSLNGGSAAAATTALLGMSQGITDVQELTALATAAAQAYASLASNEPGLALQTRTPVVGGTTDLPSPNVGSQVLLGMMLFFTLFGASTPARSILDEHREGTLPRLFTTPTRRSVILGGKYLSVFLVVLVQTTVLLLAGRFLLGARWGEPGPVTILLLCSTLVATSLGLVTVSFAKTPAQAGAVSSAIFVFLGLVSGSFTGTIGLTGAYAVVRRVSPLGWLMEGWTSLLYGGSWNDIWQPALVALAFALAFFALATFFFRRRYA